MSKSKKPTFFWASYADLMTSLFFVVLVLFVLTTVILQREKAKIEAERNVTRAQLDKIREVENATKDIDPKYFTYNSEYKKHILNIPVRFATGSSVLNISEQVTQDLINAGKSMSRFVAENLQAGIQYLIIIEGQASKDIYSQNYELSYLRALELKKFWGKNQINFGSNCEVLICGSGDGKLSGTDLMRDKDETLNQRFLIHIIPKYGAIK